MCIHFTINLLTNKKNANQTWYYNLSNQNSIKQILKCFNIVLKDKKIYKAVIQGLRLYG